MGQVPRSTKLNTSLKRFWKSFLRRLYIYGSAYPTDCVSVCLSVCMCAYTYT